MIRVISALILLLGLAACSDTPKDLSEPVVSLGDFRLGHAEVVAPNLQKLLVSRDATKEEWITEVDKALEERFRRFSGDKYYHLGVSVEAYSLPPPIIPGKSALAMHVTLWDDETRSKVNAKPKSIHVIKVFESRLSKNREQQMRGLALEAAQLVEKWLREMQETEGWFGGVAADADN